jgi:hypothetical protein
LEVKFAYSLAYKKKASSAVEITVGKYRMEEGVNEWN